MLAQVQSAWRSNRHWLAGGFPYLVGGGWERSSLAQALMVKVPGGGPWRSISAALSSARRSYSVSGSCNTLSKSLISDFSLAMVGGVGDLLHLLAQALEIGGGDLQGVEEQRGFLVGEEVVGESAHDAVEGELKAGGVLDDGEDEFAAARGDGLVEAAEVASAESGLAAGLAGEQRVAAARRLVLGVELGGVYFLIRVHGPRTPFIMESMS